MAIFVAGGIIRARETTEEDRKKRNKWEVAFPIFKRDGKPNGYGAVIVTFNFLRHVLTNSGCTLLHKCLEKEGVPANDTPGRWICISKPEFFQGNVMCS